MAVRRYIYPKAAMVVSLLHKTRFGFCLQGGGMNDCPRAYRKRHGRFYFFAARFGGFCSWGGGWAICPTTYVQESGLSVSFTSSPTLPAVLSQETGEGYRVEGCSDTVRQYLQPRGDIILFVL